VRNTKQAQEVLLSSLAEALVKAGPDAEAAAKVIFSRLGADTGGTPAILREKQVAEDALGTQRLVRLLESAPPPVRRAIASAVLTSLGASAETIAEAMMHKGGAIAARQEIVSRLEVASPVVRQLTAIAAGLPFNAGLEKIVETLLGTDAAPKGILGAAKGMVSLKDGGDAATDRRTWLPQPVSGNEDRIGYLLGFETLNMRHESTQADKDGISAWFRSIVDLLVAARTSKGDTTVRPQESTQAGARPYAGRSEPTAAQNAAHAGEHPQTWHSWLDGCTKTLADPAVAKEAAFHALAAKEHVNFFELPLPWMPGGALELWVESDADGERNGDGDAHRVLLGMTFSALGEIRVGLESRGKRLNIRIWAEKPGPIEGALPQLRDELEALGFDAAISLSQFGRGEAVQSIKSVLSGPSLNAIG
jgi:hypothetical protein